MQRYILFRFFQILVTLFIISIIVFALSRATGDPSHLLLPGDATPEMYEQMRHELGLDQPVYAQYFLWLSNVIRGDFGKSIQSKVAVGDLIMQRLPNSLSLAGAAMAIALLVALFLGVISAINKDSPIDLIARAMAFGGMSLPHFWLGLMLMLIFSVWLRWLPAGGTNAGFLSFLMPAFTLGMGTIGAGGMRLLRSSMLEVLGTEYTKLARVKGVSEGRIIWVHCMRNAIIPLLTFSGMYLGMLVGAAVVTEVVFSWPGMGRLAYDAVMWRDFPLLQGIVLVLAAIIMVVNLIVDVLYAYIDPRIRY